MHFVREIRFAREMHFVREIRFAREMHFVREIRFACEMHCGAWGIYFISPSAATGNFRIHGGNISRNL